ncbi:MAG: bifunctional nicotinamidase/pyrazinamidase [Treponema sp.]|jgi:nicotinamidase/pyrazinamidase|nr:bifunctional nicotinamidase/pyrazinamidase [Treponema sp.]
MVITKTLLLEIDVQNDFCPAYAQGTGGALAVPDGCAVVKPLNALAAAVGGAGGFVAATQDWHPAGHISFASSHSGKKIGDIINIAAQTGQAGLAQGLWPDHCVQGGWGADFHAELDLKPAQLIVRKGFRKGLDSYSAFFENDRKTSTGLEGWIRRLGIETVIIGGLATDYCVFFSAMDAKKLGFDTIIVEDGVRGVGLPAGSVEKAASEMRASGIVFAASAELLEKF